jgi:hypothetical protein
VRFSERGFAGPLHRWIWSAPSGAFLHRRQHNGTLAVVNRASKKRVPLLSLTDGQWAFCSWDKQVVLQSGTQEVRCLLLRRRRLSIRYLGILLVLFLI